MSVRNLKFFVRFMNEGNSLHEYVLQAKSFFNSCHQEKFSHSVSAGEVMKYTKDLNCDAELYEILFTVICTNIKRDSDVENFGSAIGKQWCDCAKNNSHLHWLIADKSNIITTNYKSHYGTAKASEFAFGTMPDMKTFVQCYVFCQRGSFSSILCSISHLERHFMLYIANKHKAGCQHTGEMGHKILIQYDSLIRIVANIDPAKEAAELFLHMEHPPFLYVTRQQPNENNNNIETYSPVQKISKAKEMELSSEKFERTFSLGCECNHTFCNTKIKVGKALVLKIAITDKFQTRWLIEQLMLRKSKKTEIVLTYVNTAKVNDNVKAFKVFPWSGKENISVEDKFNCEYAWKAVTSRSHVLFHQFSMKCKEEPSYITTVMNGVSSCSSKNPKAAAKALFHISDMIDKGVMFLFDTTFRRKYLYFSHFIELNQLPKGMCYVRRVVITPSRILFLRPYEHFDNRIIRKFGVEYMLRVSVQDDNFNKLTYAVQYNSHKEEIMEEAVGKILHHGLHVASRHYVVLAASSSQLREHGLWMYAADGNGNTALSIRVWMGNFSAIKNVAKYMARMGQCLSTTEEGVQVCIDKSSEFFMKDIKSKNKRYIFSDGIGVVSSSLANEVRLALMKNRGLSPSDPDCYQPSAFQIRYKGCKGMVVEDPTIPERALGLRPSMKKFECVTSDQLEIVKTSAPRKLFLNKHLITILEQMGIPKETFLDLQSDMMLGMLESLMSEKPAVTLLHHLNSFFPFKDLQEAGLCLTNEPFFRTLLLAIFKSLTANLCSSMRIAIPEQYGRNMLAVLDETNTLLYGQVFVQYSESTSNPVSNLKVHEGPVIVTKNPSLHPGDVRKLTAVDVEALHHIKDCIVFPARGQRPHPDEMAGSDLDGDECVVLWHKPLIYHRENAEPMDYPVYEETSNLENIELSDMVKFFCHYIQNDCIGSFAHAHLVWADKLKEGIFSRKCMRIAERYPYVLDFAKHGTTKYLNKSERPDQYPDFMQKGLRGNSYHSKRALGTLYRSSRVLNACSSKISLTAETTSYNPDLEYFGWQKYRASAEKHKQEYIGMMTEILKRYCLKSEAEAFAGLVELDTTKMWRQEKSDAIKVVNYYVQNIMFIFKNVFQKEVQDEVTEENLSKHEARRCQLRRASAWYMVVYSEKTSVGLSFPWVLSDILVSIKREKAFTHRNSFFDDIDADIQSCVSVGILKFDINQESCKCWSLAKAILLKWVSVAKLNIWSNDSTTTCGSCFERIVSCFHLSPGLRCCSVAHNGTCACFEECSPAKLIVNFLKFFIKNTKDSIGKCEKDCDGFIARNLQELSLQTLAYLTVTRNIFYLGLEFNTTRATRNAIATNTYEGIFEEEGDPIRIPVKTDILKDVIEEYRDEILAYLKKSSGVQHVFLRPESDLHSNLHLIVNSSGKNWQRWNLQEILLDPDFTVKILRALDAEHKFGKAKV